MTLLKHFETTAFQLTLLSNVCSYKQNYTELYNCPTETQATTLRTVLTPSYYVQKNKTSRFDFRPKGYFNAIFSFVAGTYHYDIYQLRSTC